MTVTVSMDKSGSMVDRGALRPSTAIQVRAVFEQSRHTWRSSLKRMGSTNRGAYCFDPRCPTSPEDESTRPLRQNPKPTRNRPSGFMCR